MSLQSAMLFIVNASQDGTLLGRVREITGISGDFVPGQISEAQFSKAAAYATQAGYDFTPDELKITLERLLSQQESGEQELAESELDLVAGGFATNLSAEKQKSKTPSPVSKTATPLGPVPIPYPNQG